MPADGTFSLDRLRGRAVVRDPDEDHRAATPLELLFDLTFVVAVGRAADALHHQLAAGEIAHGLTGFAALFFAVWWAWMNFTWFASAHDADDVPYRLLALVQIAGALVLAAGVSQAVEEGRFVVVTIGYSIMRIGLVINWLRVARDSPASRPRAYRYALGVTLVQVLWLSRLALPGWSATTTFVLLVVAELLVPMWAERTGAEPIFNAKHIEERYGLFTLIVLGESILAATAGFQAAVDEAGLTKELLTVGICAVLLAFSAWWIYFDHPGHLAPTRPQGFRWGYAHAIVFAALAATGAGIHVAADQVAHLSEGHPVEARTAALAVAVPVAGFLVGLVVVMLITGTPWLSVRVLPKLAGATVMVVTGIVASVTATAVVCALVMVVLVSTMVLSAPGAMVARGDDSVAPRA